MMKILETDYIIGMWFASDYNGNDWMLLLLKRNNKYIASYRFRYRKDDKVFGSKDEKSVYGFQIDAEKITEEEAIEKIHTLFKIIKIKFPREARYLEVKGDINKFMYLGAQEDFFHVKTGSKEEMEEFLKKGGEEDGRKKYR